MRRAACSCGQLSIACHGDPVRISMCHCLACQQRTGSVFGVQARFPRDKVETSGESTTFTRAADSGNTVSLHFCPRCGSTVYWMLSGFPDLVAVAVGCFRDPSFPPPRHSVYGAMRHPWTVRTDEIAMEHLG